MKLSSRVALRMKAASDWLVFHHWFYTGTALVLGVQRAGTRWFDRDGQGTYARKHGYFWLPCSSCGEWMGGHEWLIGTENDCSIPVSDTLGEGICPTCTRAGVGTHAWAAWRKKHGTPEPFAVFSICPDEDEST